MIYAKRERADPFGLTTLFFVPMNDNGVSLASFDAQKTIAMAMCYAEVAIREGVLVKCRTQAPKGALAARHFEEVMTCDVAPRLVNVLPPITWMAGTKPKTRKRKKKRSRR